MRHVWVPLLLAFPTLASAVDRPVGPPFETRSVVMAKQGMAATSQPLATEAALAILKAGGSAVDAAIAANAVLGLTEPVGCGVGGDLFAIVWDAETRKLHGLNASGRSPASLSFAQLKGELEALGLERIPPVGPLPVSVPGTVDGWFSLHERFGRLSMEEILAPAIRYAEEGFPLTPIIAYFWERNAVALKDQPGFAAVFMPDGRAPRAAEIFRNPGLAYTYRRLAAEGREVFYEGDIARRIAEHMQDNDGYLSAADMAAHTSEWVDPVSTTYRGYDVWELPPNGQGIAALQMLNVLEQYDIESMGFGSADYIHLLVEAKKLAFADRAKFYADPSFAPAPVAELISKDYARERAQLIDQARAAKVVEPGDPAALEQGDTIYLAVADAYGNMVSLIQSNYRGMGSGMTPEGLGFVLQDRGELFSLEPGHANVYAPGKRPFHTIIPAFVTKDDEPLLAFGVMGGAMQPQGHVQVLVNIIDFDMGLQAAGDAPRVRHDGSSQPTGETMVDGGVLQVESGFDAEVLAELRRRGHTIGDRKGGFGGYQAVGRYAPSGVYVGASESRKDGHAAGY